MIRTKLALTVVIITHRNDVRFVSALKSSQIATKIIVVDNNSGNDWEKLKKDYSFELISRENKITNFAKVRNETLNKVKTEWVFFLDSDETLGNTSEKLSSNREKIKQIIVENLFDGVTITRKDVFLGKSLMFGEAGNASLVRMFKVGKGKFIRNVHETVKVSGQLGASEIIVSHFSHTDVSEFMRTVAVYAKMASKNEKSSKLTNVLKMIFYPPLKFLQNYFLKLGFLDGYRGTIYALVMSLHSFFVRIFYFEEYFKENKNESKN